jgi:hypothetical protein
MSSRVSGIILLCEDDPQEQLVREYTKKCGLNTNRPYFIPCNASRAVHGGNVGWVIQEFPRQFHACRQRQARAKTLLIVVADADDFTVQQRRKHFEDAAVNIQTDDPLVLLIPRRHIETWIRNALGTTVDESSSYKHPEPKRGEIQDAARRIYEWSRQCPQNGSSCVESLLIALPEWRKIG